MLPNMFEGTGVLAHRPTVPGRGNLSGGRWDRTRATYPSAEAIDDQGLPAEGHSCGVLAPGVPAEATAPSAQEDQPDLGKLNAVLRGRMEVRSLGLTRLLVLAVLYTLYFARAFLVAILLGLVF